MIRDEVPLGHALVYFDRPRRSVSENLVLELLRILLRFVDLARNCVIRVARTSRRVSRGSVEPKLFHRVEDEGRLPVTAPIDVAGGFVRGAVVPEVDAVGLLELATGFGERQGGCELGAVRQAAGVGGGEVAEVDGHEVVGV